MQFTKVANELITDEKIDAYQFRIYTYLISLYNEEEGCAFPSLETISKNLNMGLTTVKKAIKTLVNLGYLTIEKRKRIVKGNYNTYKNLKHLIRNKVDSIKKKIFKPKEKIPKKPYQKYNNKKMSQAEKDSLGLGFNNFTPREYDYEDLERKLLGWSNSDTDDNDIDHDKKYGNMLERILNKK